MPPETPTPQPSETPQAGVSSTPATPPSPARSTVADAWRRPSTIIAIVALALLGWQWVETRSRLWDIREELTKRLSEGDAVAVAARTQAKQAQEDLLALQGKVAALDAKLAETQGQQVALEAMYQELSRSRDERLLAEVEQSVSIAAQQLQLAGNVEAALIALQSADSRLSRATNPRLLGLRKTLAADIARLRALPAADVPGIALKLESVAVGVDAMPLAFEQRPKADAVKPARSPAELGYWEALVRDLWNDTKQLIRIERIDRPEPGLLSPSQSFFLRENLKLRLVNARLALLSHDTRSFKEDVSQSRLWLERYFDTSAKPVQAALATLKGLASVDMATELPSLDQTLNTLRNYKLAQDRDSPPPGPRPAGGGDGGSAARGAASGKLDSPALGRPGGGAK